VAAKGVFISVGRSRILDRSCSHELTSFHVGLRVQEDVVPSDEANP